MVHMKLVTMSKIWREVEWHWWQQAAANNGSGSATVEVQVEAHLLLFLSRHLPFPMPPRRHSTGKWWYLLSSQPPTSSLSLKSNG